MKNVKKTLSLLLVLLLIASLFGCTGKKYEITHSYDEIYDSKDIWFDVNDDGIYTIFKINDTHFINGTCKKDKQTLEEIKSALDSTPYDLIIVDGDLIEGYNSKLSFNKYQAAAKFGELIDSYGVPWTFAPGNNDGQKDGTNEDLIAFFMQYATFIYGNEKGLDGSMQFFIDLKQNGKLVHSIAVMDSNALDSNGDYDYIKQSQIDWLVKGTNERKVKTSVFFHMPTPAFKAAYEQGTAYADFPFSDEYAVDDIKKNEQFDSAIADNEYISLISTAHVHSDNIAYFYNNRYYQLSSLGGYNAVGSKNTAPSYTLIKINVNEPDTQKAYEFSKISASAE